MATKLRVRYSDGRTVDVIASPRAQVMTEQHLGGITDANQLQAAYYLAWASLHKAGKEPADYETWLDLIEDAEEIPNEDSGVGGATIPTTAASPDMSSS